MIGLLQWVILVGYGLLLVSIAVVFARRQGDSTGFYLGGRTLSTIQVFGTTFSTFLGTGLVFTLAAFGYRFGIGALVLPGAAVAGFILLAWAAPRIKAMSDDANAITLPGMMAGHWSDRTMALAALTTAMLFTGTLAANLYIVGELLDVFVGVPRTIGIAVFAVLVITTTVVGGFRGVVWTDFVQTILIGCTILLLVPALLIGGVGSAAVDSLSASQLDPFGLPVPVLGAYLLIGVFAFFGSQDLFQRIFAAEDAMTAQRGMLGFAGAIGVVGLVAIGLGIVARTHLPAVDPDRSLLLLAELVTPEGGVGLVAIGFLALANSDADSQLLTVASNVTEDLLVHLVSAPVRRQQVVVDRLVVAGIGSIATVIALSAPGLTALFGMLGSWFAILGLVVVATLFWSRTTDLAAFSGLAVGFVAPTVFVLVTGNFQAATMVGLLPAAIVVGAVSVLTPRTRSSSVPLEQEGEAR
jgi:Na+/proline symporter